VDLFFEDVWICGNKQFITSKKALECFGMLKLVGRKDNFTHSDTSDEGMEALLRWEVLRLGLGE